MSTSPGAGPPTVIPDPSSDSPARAALPHCAYLAFMWCVAFATLHVYWAVGGSVGLASSAGADLATRRPPVFVLVGLWGTALLLLLGALFSAALARGRPRGRLRRVALLACWLVGTTLLVRGVVLQLVLATGAGRIASSVGPFQTRWSLVLWNPWFTLGGVAFLLTAHHFGRLGRAPGTMPDRTTAPDRTTPCR